jgi:hypothetical protein
MVHRRVFLGQDDPGRPVSTGFHAGQDAGLMIALNVIVAEQTRQDEAATVAALDPRRHADAATPTRAVPRIGRRLTSTGHS